MQSESLRKQVKAIWAILAMLTIWQIATTAKVNTFLPNLDSISNNVSIILSRITDLENLNNEVEDKMDGFKEIYEEQSKALESFEERFSNMRETYGSGALFEWRGEMYTTYYAEEIVNYND